MLSTICIASAALPNDSRSYGIAFAGVAAGSCSTAEQQRPQRHQADNHLALDDHHVHTQVAYHETILIMQGSASALGAMASEWLLHACARRVLWCLFELQRVGASLQ